MLENLHKAPDIFHSITHYNNCQKETFNNLCKVESLECSLKFFLKHLKKFYEQSPTASQDTFRGAENLLTNVDNLLTNVDNWLNIFPIDIKAPPINVTHLKVYNNILVGLISIIPIDIITQTKNPDKLYRLIDNIASNLQELIDNNLEGINLPNILYNFKKKDIKNAYKVYSQSEIFLKAVIALKDHNFQLPNSASQLDMVVKRLKPIVDKVNNVKNGGATDITEFTSLCAEFLINYKRNNTFSSNN